MVNFLARWNGQWFLSIYHCNGKGGGYNDDNCEGGWWLQWQVWWSYRSDITTSVSRQILKMQIIYLFLLPLLGRTKVTEVITAITFNVKRIGKKLRSKLAKPIRKKKLHNCDSVTSADRGNVRHLCSPFSLFKSVSFEESVFFKSIFAKNEFLKVYL